MKARSLLGAPAARFAEISLSPRGGYDPEFEVLWLHAQGDDLLRIADKCAHRVGQLNNLRVCEMALQIGNDGRGCVKTAGEEHVSPSESSLVVIGQRAPAVGIVDRCHEVFGETGLTGRIETDLTSKPAVVYLRIPQAHRLFDVNADDAGTEQRAIHGVEGSSDRVDHVEFGKGQTRSIRWPKGRVRGLVREAGDCFLSEPMGLRRPAPLCQCGGTTQ